MNEAQQFTLVLAANPDGSVQAMALDPIDVEVASATGKSIAYAVMNLGVKLEARELELRLELEKT